MGVSLISTGVYGPIPENTVGLIIGRSSLTLQGLSIQIGLIDSDYKQEIKIMAQSNKSFSIYKGQRIAQLLLLSYHKPNALPIQREGGFGSTGNNIYWQTFIGDDCPEITITINGKIFLG